MQAVALSMNELPHGATEDTEKALVEAARRGDGDAFSELVKRHQARVFKLAGRFFRKREDVEEVAQDTFLKAWEKLHTYRAEAPLENWLTRVCLNTCYMRIRREKPAEPLNDETVRAVFPRPDVRLDIERLLASLPPKDRFLLLLLYGEEWSVAEVAQALGWSRSNVKVRAFRARKRLRRLVEEGTRDGL